LGRSACRKDAGLAVGTSASRIDTDDRLRPKAAPQIRT
jgi:hypothetical protein